MRQKTYFLVMGIKHTWKVNISFVTALSFTLLILYLSLANLGKIDIINISASDKVYHAGAYFVLALLWFLFFYLKKQSFSNSVNFLIIGSLILFGIIIEVLQYSLTTYRTLDWWDVMANTVGIISAYISYLIVKLKLL
jgi:hypothetical protein